MAAGDDRLLGAWIPDPDIDDAEYTPTLVIDQDDVWFVTRQDDGMHQHRVGYRLASGSRLVFRDWYDEPRPPERIKDVRYTLEDEVLVLNGRRYLRADDPDARAWPPELKQSAATLDDRDLKKPRL